MRIDPATRLISVLLFGVACGGCASAAPFSVPTPGLETLQQEEAHFYSGTPEAMTALGTMPVRDRVGNVRAVYEQELARARRAQGGLLNTTLSVFGLVLPISGTVGAIALSNADDIQTVSIIAGTATTVIMGLNLLFKPAAKSAAAAQCASFLESALQSYGRRYSPEATPADTPQAWHTYLTMRATLEPGRVAACGG